MISQNLGKCFDASRWAEKTALIEPRDFSGPERRTSYAELDKASDAVARALVGRGFRKRDRIGLLGLNSFELLAAYFGIMRAGMVVVPFSFKLAQGTINHIVQDAELAAIFHDAQSAEKCPKDVMRLSLENAAFAEFLDHGPFDTFEPTGRELAMILYTSGSTGLPKGVLLSHESQRFSLEQGNRLLPNKDENTYIVAAPMFHMNATISVKGALSGGATLVLLPGFNANHYARSIDAFGVTWLTSVPTMLALVAKEADTLGGLDFSTVSHVTMGSAPLTQSLIDKVQAIFPKALIANSYGTTEGGPSPFGPHPDAIPRPPLSLGYPFDGVEVALKGDNPDQGVFYVRSPMVMEGYNKLPEKTASVLKDGWYCSGDIMRRDENGFYYFVGRADDMFNVGGENVWPGEVEKLLETMDGVHQACVVPAPHETKGAAPFAFVVPAPGAVLTEKQVKDFALANGPAHAHPRNVRLTDAIPLAGTNKPDRAFLTALAREDLAKHA